MTSPPKQGNLLPVRARLRHALIDNPNGMTAEKFAERIQANVETVRTYLNEMYRERAVVKFSTHPNNRFGYRMKKRYV